MKLFKSRSYINMCLKVIKNLKSIIESSIKEKDFATLGLSGGSTPELLYKMMADKKGFDVDWNKIHLFLVDERYVEKTSILSNYKMISGCLLSHIPIPKSNIHFIPTDSLNPEIDAQKYKSEILNFFKVKSPQKGIPNFDILLMGVGKDGHTASLFPNTPSINEINAIILATPPPTTALPEVPRITMTFPLINASKYIIFMASEKEKEKILKDFNSSYNSPYPFSLVKGTIETIMMTY